MAHLNNVNPGDLIKAADWNALVAAVQALSGPVTAGGVAVPDFFGFTLGTAAAILDLPSSQLVLGRILDVFGETISPRSPNSVQLLVLGQSPAVGTTVPAGSLLNLVVSPTPGSPSSGVVPATLGVTDVITNMGKGTYNAVTDTITLPKGTVAPASIVLQATAPNGTNTYKTTGPTFDSAAWNGVTIQNHNFVGSPTGVQIKVAITPLPASGSTKMHFGFASNPPGSISVTINPTIQISAT